MFELTGSLMELVITAVFIFSASIMFLAFALAALRSSREPRESRAVTPHVMAVAPRKPSGSVAEEAKTPINPPVNTMEKIREITHAPRTIRLEIEFPELPETIRIPLEKLPKLLEVIKEGREEEAGIGREMHHNFVVQGEEAKEERKSWSAMKHYDRPWLDILSRVSGLEFSEDGEKVYCPRHGWTYYIVASDGRILCGEGKETLWDPNKERYRPPDRRELMKLQKELMDVKREIGELQHIAEMRPPRTKTKPREEAREEYIEEEYEEEPEEEETEA